MDRKGVIKMFKVRDRVTSIKFGRGTVMCVSPVWVYKVIVQFDNSTDEGSSVMHYTQNDGFCKLTKIYNTDCKCSARNGDYIGI
jgi:hypothetical protein